MRTFHEDHTLPPAHEVDWIFVFGSNRAGRHGGGAALIARVQFEAEWGIALGLTGKSYAIPTKADNVIDTLESYVVRQHVQDFVEFATKHPNLRFWVTAVGTGLAGIPHEVMAPMFADAPDNCSMPDTWREWLEVEA